MKKMILLSFILIGIMPWASAQNGLNFDGNNDFVQTNYPGVLSNANRTFEAWIFVNSSAPSSNLAVLDYGLNAAGKRNTFGVNGNRGLFFISGGTNANISTPSNIIPVNQWVHVAFVLNNGTGYLYANGIQQGTGSLTSVNTSANAQNVKIGNRVSGGSIPFHGSIDEVRVWDVARTPAEIQAQMNSELCGVHPNLQVYLQFNEGAAGGTNTGTTTAPDNSGNAYNGTLNNFSLSGATSNWVSGSGITAGGSPSNSFLQQSSCDSFSLTPNSTLYTTSGIYTETLIGANAAGCDSIILLDLTIFNSISTTDTQNACDSYTWIDGITYTSNNNTATHTLTTAAGCDSVVTLDLTVYSISSVDTQTACGSYTWIDGNTYTSNNNTATHTLTTAAGCDSVVTLNLIIDMVNSAVIQDGTLLTADAMGMSYQWVECPSMTPINGATSQSYTAIANGSYAVIVTNNNQCSDTSNCYSVTNVGTIENEFGNNLLLFPNPTNGKFSIDMGTEYKTTTVTITDLTGKLIVSDTYNNSQFLNLNLKTPAGVYLLMITSENKRAVIRLVKK